MPGLRVIAGKLRGFRLHSVPGDTTRPITDRTKEALFNIIGADIEGANILDLFAGTGSVGIEALSRGAASAVFVDINRLPVETIKANLKATGFTSQSQVLRMDAFAFMDKPASQEFDYIYIAPPQYKGIWMQALKLVDANPGWLVVDGWVIVQIHPVEEEPLIGENELLNLDEFDRRNYGSTLLLFYARKDNHEQL